MRDRIASLAALGVFSHAEYYAPVQRLPIILATARKKVMQYDLCVALLLQIVCPTFPKAKAWSDR